MQICYEREQHSGKNRIHSRLISFATKKAERTKMYSCVSKTNSFILTVEGKTEGLRGGFKGFEALKALVNFS